MLSEHRYLITINETDIEENIRVMVTDQKTFKTLHDHVYSKGLLDILKERFLNHYGRDQVTVSENLTKPSC